MHKLLEMGTCTAHQERVKPLLLSVIDLAFKTVLWQVKRVRGLSELHASSESLIFALQQK